MENAQRDRETTGKVHKVRPQSLREPLVTDVTEVGPKHWSRGILGAIENTFCVCLLTVTWSGKPNPVRQFPGRAFVAVELISPVSERTAVIERVGIVACGS